MPPTKYVKSNTRPSVPPYHPQLTSHRANRPQLQTISPGPSSSIHSQIRQEQNFISQFENSKFSIPPPRKRATPRPAFGRFVPPTGSSKTINNKTEIGFVYAVF